MAGIETTYLAATRAIRKYRSLVLPIGAATLMLVILVPLPPVMMDILLAGNIALAAVILMTAIGVSSPLEFSVFPSVLLGATLLRLVLNIASTRLILTAGAGGQDVITARYSAGHVIWSFSEFVTSGSLAVGVILFAIIAVIQFVVITKGAGRISEVAARFVLDAMPGKQMGIDADLGAGTIDESQAQQRRNRIAREADFYGAMDGASKFVRGDAIAAVVITLVNIFGGLYVGLVQYGWNWDQTLDLFTRLTVGDGLATQIPALLVSVSAALIVSRSMDTTDFGDQVVRQLTSRPVALAVTAGFLAALMFTHLPKMPLLLMGVGCAGLAWVLSRRKARRGARETFGTDTDTDNAPHAVSTDKQLQQLLTVEPVRIELGFALVALVDSESGGDLLDRLGGLRRELAVEIGLLVPPVRVTDEMNLSAHEYVLRIRGAKVAGDRLYPGQLLAVAGQAPAGKVTGRDTLEPAFGTPAVWITPEQASAAEAMGYTVTEPANVLITHLAETLRSRASDLLSRQQVAGMLEALSQRAGAVVADASERVGLARIHKVLQELLAERVSIRDLETILEALCDGPDGEDVDALAQRVRRALAGALSQQYCARDGRLWCVCLDEALEQRLADALGESPTAAAALGPEGTGKLNTAVTEAIARLRSAGHRPVVLCRPAVRRVVRDLVGHACPQAAVLGYDEVCGVDVQAVASVGIEQ